MIVEVERITTTEITDWELASNPHLNVPLCNPIAWEFESLKELCGGKYFESFSYKRIDKPVIVLGVKSIALEKWGI